MNDSVPRNFNIPDYLQGVPESFKAFNDLATSCSPLVRPVELKRQQQGDDNCQDAREQSSDDTGHVVRLVLLPEDCTANDTTNTACSNEGR